MLTWIIVTISLLSLTLYTIAKLFDFVMEPELGTLKEHIEDIENGRCPHCDALHPEATTTDDEFWKTFNCPECGYKTNIHVKSDEP